MNLPNFLRAQGNVVYLSLKVQPRASRTEIAETLGAELKVKVAAPPVDAAANDALVRFLADTLDCPRSAVQLVKGQASRHKIIAVHGLSPHQVAARLSPNIDSLPSKVECSRKEPGSTPPPRPPQREKPPARPRRS